MKPSLLQRLEQLDNRLIDVEKLLQNPNVTDNLDEYRKLTKENAELNSIVTVYRDYKNTVSCHEQAIEMMADPDFKEMAQEEFEATKKRLEELEAEIRVVLLPKDPDDNRSVFVEIRAGTGGDESALFAGDLARMYMRYAEVIGWKSEYASESPSDMGGYKEVIIKIIGEGVYGQLKFESGTHRVQRVPATETQGRVHTSAATVAVMPEADEVSDIVLSPSDLRIDTFRASGAGGQHINKTDSAIRITHLPTGTVVECQDGRSQHQNKAKAMQVLITRIKDKQTREAQALQAAERKSLVGSGDRSERIRTYNFPQGRLTDHRINLTLYRLEAIMEGDIGEVIQTLRNEYQAEQLANFEE